MIYTTIMDAVVGWYNKIEGLFLRLALLPAALILVVIGNVVAAPLFLVVFIFKSIRKRII